ncbi:MAG: Hpt domain-containing protein [Clostridia bacterium]|nr:Hpt domain-containing protein [Clostridia bacterium]
MGEIRDTRALCEAYGVNYDETMERFMGKEKSYLKFLGMLFDDGSLDSLKTALDKNDFEGAFHFAHTLKGLSSNLGLVRMYEQTVVIVESLRTKDTKADYQAMYNVLLQQFEKVKEFYAKMQECVNEQ